MLQKLGNRSLKVKVIHQEWGYELEQGIILEDIDLNMSCLTLRVFRVQHLNFYFVDQNLVHLKQLHEVVRAAFVETGFGTLIVLWNKP